MLKRFEVTRPGQYVLTIRTSLRHTAGLPGGVRSLYDKLPGPVLEKVYTFPLTVIPQNSQRLEAAAKNLVGLITSPDSSIGVQEAAIEGLFAMPAKVALPSWRALIADPKLYRVEYALGEISLYKTRSAVDLLAEFAWSKTLGEYQRKKAREGLENVYYGFVGECDPAVRSHIKQLFVDHEGKAPKSFDQVDDKRRAEGHKE